MEFANAEIEDLKENDNENKVKIKKHEENILYQELYNRRENLRFFGFPESADGAENTHEVVQKFLSDELEMENAADIEFQRAHRIGKKKTGETRIPGDFSFFEISRAWAGFKKRAQAGGWYRY